MIQMWERTALYSSTGWGSELGSMRAPGELSLLVTFLGTVVSYGDAGEDALVRGELVVYLDVITRAVNFLGLVLDQVLGGSGGAGDAGLIGGR